MRAPRPFDKPIYVTRPFLPPLAEFQQGLEEIWSSGILTNNGPVHQRYWRELCRYLDTDNISLFANGTLALQIAIQGLRLSGEVITTPYTFVGTTHALYWNRIRPVFCDIEPDFYTLDPRKIEAAITPWTTAILAVHVYGYPCQVDALAKIARQHGLKLIYDAAHAFGVSLSGRSIADFGDLSMFSFHATKLYHTFEGGMLTFRDSTLRATFDYLRNFGFASEVEVVTPGTNAKMNEIQALMGLQMLRYLDKLIERRRNIHEFYCERLKGIPGLRLPPTPPADVRYNYAYFPVQIDEEDFGMSRDEVYYQMRDYNVYPRRYFYPLICDFACYRNISVQDPLIIARRAAARILTLPIYDTLTLEEAEKICDIVWFLSERRSALLVPARLPNLETAAQGARAGD